MNRLESWVTCAAYVLTNHHPDELLLAHGFCAFAAVLMSARAQVSPDPTAPIIVFGSGATTQVTVQIGIPPPIGIVASPPQPPINVPLRADLKILALPPAATYGAVRWYKDGKQIDGSGPALEIQSATPADSGRYSCSVKMQDGTYVISDDPAVLVSGWTGQRVINYSVLAKITAAQPVVTTGFVVEPGPAYTWIVFRAVGQSLLPFGISDGLRQPKLVIRDARGQMAGSLFLSIVSLDEQIAESLGAFPLISPTTDITAGYYLSAGAYTAQVSAADGGTGTVLFEMYQG